MVMTTAPFFIQKNERKKDGLVGIVQGRHGEVSLPREWGTFPEQVPILPLGGTFLFIFPKDPWLCPSEFLPVHCPP